MPEYTGELWSLGYRGAVLGGSSVAYLEEVSGLLDAPEVRSGDHEMLQRDGLAPGEDYLGGREVALTFTLVPDGPGFGDEVSRIIAAFMPGHSESPLRFHVPGVAGGNEGFVSCRVRKRAVKLDDTYAAGGVKVDVELFATDPRLYAGEESRTSIGLPPVITGGLSFPARFPIRFGTATTQAQRAGGLPNTGNAETWPTFVIHGPVRLPTLTNRADAAERLAFALELSATESLTVDTFRRAARLNGTANRYTTLLPGSRWFPLRPGSNDVQFSGAQDNGEAYAEIVWRSAWV